MNKMQYLKAKRDILQAGLDAYEAAHPNMTKDEDRMFSELSIEKIDLCNLVDALRKQSQTQSLQKWLDDYRDLGGISDVNIAICKPNGDYCGSVAGSLQQIGSFLSPDLLKQPACITIIDEDDSFVELTVEPNV